MDKQSIVWGSFFLSLMVTLGIVSVVFFRVLDVSEEWELLVNSGDISTGEGFETVSVPDSERPADNQNTVQVGVSVLDGESQTDDDGVVWQRYQLPVDVSLLLPANCFVVDSDGSRKLLDEAIDQLWKSDQLVWVECLDEDSYLFTLGLGVQVMNGFKQKVLVGPYAFDKGVIRVNEVFYSLYHIALNDGRHFGLYLSDDMYADRVLDSVMIPQELVPSEEEPALDDQIDDGGLTLDTCDSCQRYILTGPSYVAWQGENQDTQHRGTLAIYDAVLFLDGEGLYGGEFVFDMESIIVTEIENKGMASILTDHLKSDEFFFVDRFPFARYRFGDAPSMNNEVQVDGFLDLRGIEKDLASTFNVWYVDDIMHTKGNLFFNRREWEVDGMPGVVDDFVGVAFDLAWQEKPLVP